MIPGVRGTLLSHEALETMRLTALPADRAVARLRQDLTRWHALMARDSGPAWPARTVFDRIARPFCALFGIDLTCAALDTRLSRMHDQEHLPAPLKSPPT